MAEGTDLLPADAPRSRRALAARPPRGDLDPYEGRGTVVVRDRAVQRIARAAAGEVGGVHEHGSRLGMLGGRSLPAVDVEVSDGQVRARVELAVAWPRPCRTVAAGVREHVRWALRELAGLGVDTVDVTVSTVLTPDQLPAPERHLR
ncbi:hypothetical protein GCM10027047_19900 [Rhodococcus aerolatus]